MKNLKIVSHLGGSEIIQVHYPELYLNAASLQEEYKKQISHTSLSNFTHSLIQKGDFKKISELKAPVNGNLIYPEILNSPIFVSENLAIYYPENENDNFWFDLVSLKFFNSTAIFNTCIFVLTSTYKKLSSVNYSQFIALLNGLSIEVANFPICIIYEEERLP